MQRWPTAVVQRWPAGVVQRWPAAVVQRWPACNEACAFNVKGKPRREEAAALEDACFMEISQGRLGCAQIEPHIRAHTQAAHGRSL